MTEKQKDLIDDMNEFCREKFKYTNETTVKEASEYISRNIEEFKLVTMSEWQTKYL
jgi:restriction endonuclease Mrr